jgi:hypothetical protein
MSDAPANDLRPAAAAFCKSAGPKMEALLPHQTAVLELRAKGASFALIARLLERIGVHVSIDTLRRLCARPSSRACDASAKAQPASLPLSNAVNLPERPPAPHNPRGPRIADPSTQ